MRRLRSTPIAVPVRSGFSLMEIIIATAILMGSVVVLARLAGMGRTMAQKADLLSNAQRICERTLNEIAIGERPLQSIDGAVLQPVGRVDTMVQEASGDGINRLKTGAGPWLYSVTVTPLEEMPELVRITVTIEPDTSSVAIEGVIALRRDRFALSRWVRTSANSSSTEWNSFGFAGGAQ